MSYQPIERVAALSIGTIEAVSPASIGVLLNTDAPQATALNTGYPTGFPRINSYLLVPNESGALVGLVVWMGIERSKFPQRTGLKDYGLVDLPYPTRKLSLTPVGTLAHQPSKGIDHGEYRLERGVVTFPSVGDSVQLPTQEQLRGIVQASAEEDKRVWIGTSPAAGEVKVTVDPDKVFGRHLAVLGNTGSGKSCSVAGLIRWSIESAREASGSKKRPNARFIVLDPNGEYASAFADYSDVRVYQVPSSGTADGQPLTIAGWMWNSEEWAAFSRASGATQRPILLQALRDLRSQERLRDPPERQAVRLLKSYKSSIEARISEGSSAYQDFLKRSEFGEQLNRMKKDLEFHSRQTDGELSSSIASLAQDVAALEGDRKVPGKWYYSPFSEVELRSLVAKINECTSKISVASEVPSVSEDAPIPFDVSELPDHVDQIASNAPGPQTAQYLSTLTMRVRMMLADGRLGPVVRPDGGGPPMVDWLSSYIGNNEAENGEITIIDLSLVPSDVLHLVVSVLARVVFEAVQRYRRIENAELPTVLVLEEAHTFIRKGSDDETGGPSLSQVCRNTFERISREGRKFGLGLVLSSQRPSELSPTVLAQCNTFLLHRIVNDRDQDLVGRLVPDNLGGLLKELPSLPARQAILLGWALPLPTLVEMRELPVEERPRSADPKFWKVWTRQEARPIDWKRIVDDWTGRTGQ